MGNSSEKVCIVIPVYQAIPGNKEIVSLLQCAKLLGEFSIVIVAPKGLQVDFYTTLLKKRVQDLQVIFFDAVYFSGISGYNELLLSPGFYYAFQKFSYILIHQLDVFVFRKDLLGWCTGEYQYVGAPWLNQPWLPDVIGTIQQQWDFQQPVVKKLLRRFLAMLGVKGTKPVYNVGNGGLSLRSVKQFTAIASLYSGQLRNWSFNEDVFWSVFVPMRLKKFYVPPQHKALSFSFDQNPAEAYKLSSSQLPFGAHAWNRDDYPYEGNLQFWLPKITPFLDEEQLHYLSH